MFSFSKCSKSWFIIIFWKFWPKNTAECEGRRLDVDVRPRCWGSWRGMFAGWLASVVRQPRHENCVKVGGTSCGVCYIYEYFLKARRAKFFFLLWWKQANRECWNLHALVLCTHPITYTHAYESHSQLSFVGAKNSIKSLLCQYYAEACTVDM